MEVIQHYSLSTCVYTGQMSEESYFFAFTPILDSVSCSQLQMHISLEQELFLFSGLFICGIVIPAVANKIAT